MLSASCAYSIIFVPFGVEQFTILRETEEEVSPSSVDGGGAGGLTDGGSTAGGSTAGGSTAGGSTAGGSTAGGSTAGGSTDGGSTTGGSGPNIESSEVPEELGEPAEESGIGLGGCVVGVTGGAGPAIAPSSSEGGGLGTGEFVVGIGSICPCTTHIRSRKIRVLRTILKLKRRNL